MLCHWCFRNCSEDSQAFLVWTQFKHQNILKVGFLCYYSFLRRSWQTYVTVNCFHPCYTNSNLCDKETLAVYLATSVHVILGGRVKWSLSIRIVNSMTIRSGRVVTGGPDRPFGRERSSKGSDKTERKRKQKVRRFAILEEQSERENGIRHIVTPKVMFPLPISAVSFARVCTSLLLRFFLSCYRKTVVIPRMVTCQEEKLIHPKTEKTFWEQCSMIRSRQSGSAPTLTREADKHSWVWVTFMRVSHKCVVLVNGNLQHPVLHPA